VGEFEFKVAYAEGVGFLAACLVSGLYWLALSKPISAELKARENPTSTQHL
jgi:hypothetical protein